MQQGWGWLPKGPHSAVSLHGFIRNLNKWSTWKKNPWLLLTQTDSIQPRKCLGWHEVGRALGGNTPCKCRILPLPQCKPRTPVGDWVCRSSVWPGWPCAFQQDWANKVQLWEEGSGQWWAFHCCLCHFHPPHHLWALELGRHNAIPPSVSPSSQCPSWMPQHSKSSGCGVAAAFQPALRPMRC